MSTLVERLEAAADEVMEFPHPSNCDHLHRAHEVMREAAAALRATTGEGEWVMVPRVLTGAMAEAGEQELAMGNDFTDAWRAAVDMRNWEALATLPESTTAARIQLGHLAGAAPRPLVEDAYYAEEPLQAIWAVAVEWQGKTRTVSEHLYLLSGERDRYKMLAEQAAEIQERMQRAIDEARSTSPAPLRDAGDKFCDGNCVWTDHHPDCPNHPDRLHPAPAQVDEGAVTDAMVDAYLAEQGRVVREVDTMWGRGGKAPSYMHPVREACRAGLRAALVARLGELEAVSSEYNDLIRYMNAGGDFSEFQAERARKIENGADDLARVVKENG